MTERPERPVVLIVDDELPNRALIRAYLENDYEIREAPDGLSALERVASTVIDLVLLDVMMPGMSGFEVCRRLKHEREEQGYMPVILLTALDQQEQRNSGLAAGADDFLSKPVDRHELQLRVATFLRLRSQDQRIRQQLDEVKQRDSIIQKQVEELKALDLIKDDLVAMMVHDLRNPLAGIEGFLGLIAKDAADEQLRSDVGLALEASGHLREIVDDILHVRMLESGAVRLHRECIEAGMLVEDAIKSVRGAARARRVEISPVIDAGRLQIDGDPKLIRRAVENLLTNAVKYSPSGATVRASVASTGSEVQIEVADRGAGVPESLKHQLFEKFGSVEVARGEVRRGVGLGLYLVKLVANAHGGTAMVRDRKSGGSAFCLLLPRLDL